MNDERLERELRAALLEDDPGPVGSGLRARIAAVPEDTALRHRFVRPPRVSRLMASAAAVAAVVLVSATLVIGLGTRRTAVGPAPSVLPSVVPVSSAPSASPAPTPTPSAPAVVLPAGAPPTSWSRVADAPLLHVSPASNTAVATARDGTFVALASAIDSRKAPVILHSVDGVTWTPGGSLPASGDTQVSAIARWGDLLVAVGDDTTALLAAMAKGEATDARPAGAAWTSTDGTTWQRVPDQPAFAPGELLHVTAGPAGLMAVRGLDFGSLVFSRDGTTWSDASVGTPGAKVSGVTATDEGFVAVGSVETAAAAWMSPDGQHWQRATFPDGSDASADLVSVAAQGRRLVALGAVPAPGDDAIPGAWTGTASWLSADGGASWMQTGSALHGTAPDLYVSSSPDLYAMSGGFIGVGPNAQGNLAVWTSLDGTKWQPATIEATGEEFGRSLAVSGSRAIIGGKTVGTGMGGDRAVFWTGEVSGASDAATALSLVARYEAASAAGDSATAWSLLATWSQRQFPSIQSFADSRKVRFAGTATAYVVGEPRTDDPTIPGWLAKSDPGVSDPGRVFSVEVTHPNASPVAAKLEVFFVALDMSGAWKIWILN